MNTVYNEEKIIKYVQDYYNKYNNTPKLTDNIHPFKISLVRKLFGGWTNVLKEANVPLRLNPPQIVNCKNCNISFTKSYSQIKLTVNHFCSHSCSASINNSNRIASNETKQKTRDSLKKFNKENPKIKKIKTCIVCKKEFNGKRKTCSDECFSTFRVEKWKNRREDFSIKKTKKKFR
jgi:predicted nucleic acid-binding Zn ribbon protein